MTFDEFDQMQDHGWREMAHRGDYAGAAAAIAAYLQTESGLEDWQRRLLRFHAAQMHAFAGDVEAALKNLPLSVDPDEPADSAVRWTAYVAATTSFLQGDREGLLAAREQIACGPEHQGTIPNLNVVDRLIANFGKPYSQAY